MVMPLRLCYFACLTEGNISVRCVIFVVSGAVMYMYHRYGEILSTGVVDVTAAQI